MKLVTCHICNKEIEVRGGFAHLILNRHINLEHKGFAMCNVNNVIEGQLLRAYAGIKNDDFVLDLGI